MLTGEAQANPVPRANVFNKDREVIFIKEILYNNKVYKHTGIRFYYISEEGEIISYYNGKPKIIKPFLNKGYHRIELKYEVGKAKKFLIHRLVYQTFIGELKDELVIDHIDGNRTNNHYLNLRLCTQKENIQNALNHNFGDNNSKMVRIKNKHTGEILTFNKIKDLINFIGVHIQNGILSKLERHSKFKENYEIINDIG